MKEGNAIINGISWANLSIFPLFKKIIDFFERQKHRFVILLIYTFIG